MFVCMFLYVFLFVFVMIVNFYLFLLVCDY